MLRFWPILLACWLLPFPHARGASTNAVVTVSERKSDWRIVAPPPGSREPAVSLAVSELRNYIRKMSGVRLEIVQRTLTKPAIVVGLRHELAPDDRRLLPPALPGYDGYAIAVQPAAGKYAARIVVGAEDGRGVLYGVYDLLERFGCRWFYPAQDPSDPEIVPTRATLSLPSGAWAVASPMKYRICNGSEWFFEMDPALALKQLDWAMKARFNAMGWQCDTHTPLAQQYDRLNDSGLFDELARRGMFLHGPGHCFNLLLPDGDYLQPHPDWFGLRGGKRVPQTFLGAQFCWSNPKARQQFAINAETFVRRAPRLNIFYLAPFDGGPACDCENCRQAGASGLLLRLVAETRQRLKGVRPDLLVETVGGYGPATEPPGPGAGDPAPRIIWAHWGRVYTRGYDDERYDRRTNLEAWRNTAAGGLTVCQYYTDNFAEPWVMSPFTIALEGDRRYFRQIGVDSVYLLMWPRGFWWNHGLNGYLAGRCFYDFGLSPYSVMADYALNYFGPDAGPFLANYLEDWARDPEFCYRLRGGAGEIDRARLADLRRRWLQPALDAAASQPLLRLRVERLEKLQTLAERLVELHCQHAEVQRLRQARELDQARAALLQARAAASQLLAYCNELADLNQGLVDRNEVEFFMTATARNWLRDEARALGVPE